MWTFHVWNECWMQRNDLPYTPKIKQHIIVTKLLPITKLLCWIGLFPLPLRKRARDFILHCARILIRVQESISKNCFKNLEAWRTKWDEQKYVISENEQNKENGHYNEQKSIFARSCLVFADYWI